jgi:type IV pilus assembly protein PilA
MEAAVSERPIRDQRGFTLIELMIVILLIGILSAIAIPMFIGKSDSADAAEAKSAARNLMTHVDSCFVRDEDFRDCSTKAELEANEADWGAGPGQVSVTDTTRTTYELVAVSRDGETFTIARSTGGQYDRDCSDGPGCKDGKW